MLLWRKLSHLFHPQRSNNHRARILHPEAIAYMCAVVFGFAALVHALPSMLTPSGLILGYASDMSVDQVIQLTNQERARSGLGALAYDEKLSQAALSKGQDMFTYQYWAHTSPAGKEPWSFISSAGYSYRVAGENLARDFMNAPDMVSAWMASPTHRANIMNAAYENIGVAVIDGTLQGVETTLVVQMFGAPRATAAEPTTTQQAAATQEEFSLTQVAQVQVEQPAPSPGVAPEQSLNAASEPSSPAAQEGANDASSAEAVLREGSALTQPATVLAGVVVPAGVLQSPLVSPLQLMKAFFLAVVLLLLATLMYDLLIAESRKTVRLAGKNLAHVILLSMVAFLLIFFKGGVVG